jgi:hypothetical protein
VSATETGYESLKDLGDSARRELLPRGTECVLSIDSFEYKPAEGSGDDATKAHIVAKFSVVGPEELEDYGSFFQRFYLNNTPKDASKPKNTAWHMARRVWNEIIAGCFQLPQSSDDVRFYFADKVTADPAQDLDGYFVEVVEALNALQGQTFPTAIGVEKDKQGKFDPKQTVGKIVFPAAEAA